MKLKRGTAARTPDQRKEWSKKVHATLTPEQRSDRARKAAQTRWKNKEENS
jgi:hypothetical protein